jgi:hypothetical protein
MQNGEGTTITANVYGLYTEYDIADPGAGGDKAIFANVRGVLWCVRKTE